MEYQSAIKRNEESIYITTWMNLTIIMLNERSQTQKGYTLSDSIYIKFITCKQIPNDRKQREWGTEGAITGGRKKHFVVMQFIIYKLYSNKLILKEKMSATSKLSPPRFPS